MAFSTELTRRLPPWLAVMRPHQWVKNGFVVLPLLFSPGAITYANLSLILLAALVFCAAASAIYIINDIADRESDRNHPLKKHRPLAAGTLSVQFATVLCLALLGITVGSSFALGNSWVLFPAVYILLNIAYSFRLKHIALVDVMIVSLGFIIRILAGCAAIGIEASSWILICTGFLSLFIAFGKRRDDVVRETGRKSTLHYNLHFVNSAMTILAAGSILTYTLYTQSAATVAHFGTDKLYMTIPFVLLGFLRYLQLCLVQEKGGTPTSLILEDTFLQIIGVCWLLSCVGVIYVF